MSTELATITQDKQVQVAEVPLSPEELIQQVKLIQRVMASVMRKGEHYGTIPGCGPKPALFKPGAEKLQLTFRLHPDFEIQETDLPQGHKNFRVVCRLKNQSGGFQGAGVGYGSTKETKYSHKGGRETNPADYYNVVLKMSKKRAQVDAILTATAASDIFTQDLEDMDLDKALDKARRGLAGVEGGGQTAPETLPRDGFIQNLPWVGIIKEVPEPLEGKNAQGPWKLFRINMEDGRTATTFKEELAKDAEIMIGVKVRVLVEPNKRKEGTWTYLGFEEITEQKEELFPKEEEPWT